MLKGNFSRESISLLPEVGTVAAIPYVSSSYVTERARERDRERVCVYSAEPPGRGDHVCQLLENSNNPIKVNRFR